MTDAFISQIRTDGGTQMRAEICNETVMSYVEHIQDGAQFPPVVVFYDGTDYWLADGFHRLAAFKQARKEKIDVDVRSGAKIDAIRYALQANATNGRPRTGNDMRRAYRVAVDNDLCQASDSKNVQSLLGCSGRWARELTSESRASAKEARDDKITKLAGEGKSQREIASEVGVDHKTVASVVSGEKRNSAVSPQQDVCPHRLDPKILKEQPTSRGVGVRCAHEAIAVMKRIPSSDGLRQDAFDIVIDWINTNRG